MDFDRVFQLLTGCKIDKQGQRIAHTLRHGIAIGERILCFACHKCRDAAKRIGLPVRVYISIEGRRVRMIGSLVGLDADSICLPVRTGCNLMEDRKSVV